MCLIFKLAIRRSFKVVKESMMDGLQCSGKVVMLKLSFCNEFITEILVLLEAPSLLILDSQPAKSCGRPPKSCGRQNNIKEVPRQ